MKAITRIVSYLDESGGNATTSTIQNALQLSHWQVASSLQTAMKYKQIRRVARGVYTTAPLPPTKALEIGGAFGPIPMSKLMAGR